jgi:hypothetical protein
MQKSLPEVPQQYSQLSNQWAQKLHKLANEDPSNWTLITKKENIFLYKKRLDTDVDCVRAIARFNKKAELVRDLLYTRQQVFCLQNAYRH